MDFYQYVGLYTEWGLMFYVAVLLLIAVGSSVAAFGESCFTRLVGLILVVGCATLLVVGAGIALELPVEGFAEEYSDAYRQYVDDPKATERVTLWGNLIVKAFAVTAPALTIVLFVILLSTQPKRTRRRQTTASRT